MKVKVIYIKNLKMSPDKIASQAAHAVIGLGITDTQCTIIVLGVSTNKFKTLINDYDDVFIHTDLGFTEVKAGTQTCAAWIEEF